MEKYNFLENFSEKSKFPVEKIIIAFIIFLILILGISVVGTVSLNYERPFANFLFLNNISGNSGISPNNFIDEGDILIYPDKIVIKINGASISRYEPTGSMKPVLDEIANGIRVKPKSEMEIDVGDIVSFKKDDFLIVHRVIEKGIDEKGIFFITKGDNNDFSDGKIRFKDIEFITIGILY